MPSMICGIDVAKRELECCLLGPEGPTWTATVPNTAAGHRQLLRRLAADTLVVLEPTASYHEPLLARLEATGRPVRLVNPRHVRRFVQAHGRGTKTDRLDAEALARYAQAIAGPQHTPRTPAQRRLRALTARLRQLDGVLEAERDRLAQARDPVVRRSLRAVQRTLARERRTVAHAIDTLITTTPALHEAAALLRTIPGVGPAVARTLLAELPDLATFRDAGQLAAYVGLAPVTHQSGTSLHHACLPRAGKPHVRATLYLPALVAARCNPDVRAVYTRLRARGKPGKVALAAAMHKLLRQCYGVLKHHHPYQPQGT